MAIDANAPEFCDSCGNHRPHMVSGYRAPCANPKCAESGSRFFWAWERSYWDTPTVWVDRWSEPSFPGARLDEPQTSVQIRETVYERRERIEADGRRMWWWVAAPSR